MELIQRLQSDDPHEALFSAWVVEFALRSIVITFGNPIFQQAPGLIGALLKLLRPGQPHCRVAAHALNTLSGPIYTLTPFPKWQPNAAEIALVVRVLAKISSDESEAKTESEAETRHHLVLILGNSRDPQVIKPLLQQLGNADERVCLAAAFALGHLNDARGFAALCELLKDASPYKRRVAVMVLARKRAKTDIQLLSCDVSGSGLGLDPQEPITAARVAEAARKLELSEEEVRSRYQALAADLPLQLDWQGEHGE